MSPPRPRPVTLGERLAAAREYAGLSVGQTAKLLAWERPRVLAHEEGSVVPPELDLARYARLYGVTVAVLREGSPPATREELLASLVCPRGLRGVSADDEAELLRFYEFLRDLPPKGARHE